MTRDDTLSWLEALQARFSAVLRTPLADGIGTLVADVARYQSAACADVLPGPLLAPAARLAVYNRQYWMRLMRTLHEQLPLTTRLLGAFELNRLAMRFFTARPPRGWDLGRVAEGFTEFVAEAESVPPFVPRGGRASAPPPREALIEAARIDEAFREVFVAPPAPVYEPAASEEALLARHLPMVRSVRRIEQHWPLVELRVRVIDRPIGRPVQLPARLPEPRAFAVFRTARGVGQLLLAPQHARLFELLERHTLGEALARFEAEAGPAAAAELPSQARRWLSQAVALGFFGESSPAARPPA